MVPFGLQGASSLLMRVMNQALTFGLDFPGDPTPTTAEAAVVTPDLASAAGLRTGPAPPWRPRQDLAPIHGGVPGASGPLGRCSLVYMDDCLVHSDAGAAPARRRGGA